MPPPRRYTDNADRMRAYRQRKAQARAEQQQQQDAAAVRAAQTAPAPDVDALETPADVQADMQARRALMDAVGL